MEFFKGLGNKISQTSQEAIKKTKELADTTKLNGEISAEEKKINSIYQLIGHKYFEMYADAPAEEFVEFIVAIKNSMDKIKDAKDEIQSLKGKRNCPKCGAELDAEIPFCSMCGEKMPAIEKQETVENEVVEDIVQSENKCPNCNETLASEAVFCPSCGTKIK